MEPATQNFVVVAGDTFKGTIALKTKATGDPIDLTDAVPKMQIRTVFGSPFVELELALGSGLTVATPASGVIAYFITIDINPGNYVYDFQITYPDTSVLTYFRGRFKVLDGVTE